VTDQPVIDSTVEEEAAELGREVVVQRAPSVEVAPAADANQLVARLGVIKAAMDQAMVRGIDYGVIPGVDKPVLAKPGAEKLSVLFQLDIQITTTKTWHDGGHLTVDAEATVFHAPTGLRLGHGEGMCTTFEKNYAKRHADRACPECEQATIKRSKFPPRDNPNAEPGWYCFAKIGGCGANFAHDDQRIIGQQTGEIENPDLPDTWNPVLKMARKRARVDAVLAVTGASALFTQDLEETAVPAPADGPQDTPQPAPAARTESLATEAQLKEIKRLSRGTGRPIVEAWAKHLGLDQATLTKAQASNLISAVESGVPAPTGESDVPGDPSEFDPRPVVNGEDVEF